MSPALGSHSHSWDKDSLDNTGSQVAPPRPPPLPARRRRILSLVGGLKSPGKGPLRQGGSGKGSHRESGAQAGLRHISHSPHWPSPASHLPSALPEQQPRSSEHRLAAMPGLHEGAGSGSYDRQISSPAVSFGIQCQQRRARAGVWPREGYSRGLLFVSPSLSPSLSPLWF